MRFRSITVGGVEYGWRVQGSADNIEVRGPNGYRCFADACEVTGLTFNDLIESHWEFDRHHHNTPFYVKFPITPKQIAAWLEKHVEEMAQPSKKRFQKTERFPHRPGLTVSARK